ncbi:MAG: 6,7-dimethyl-8-ribityllumazine synthase [Planktomarina sp.]
MSKQLRSIEQTSPVKMDRPVFDKPIKLLIVVSPDYQDIADQLLAGATAEIKAVGGTYEVVLIPGVLEIPTAISIAHRMSNFDGFVALGCVIRGETNHPETAGGDIGHALQLLGINGVCIGNGIFTVETRDQAMVRAQADGQNNGGGAAAAALHLIALTRKWGKAPGKVGFLPDEEFKLA